MRHIHAAAMAEYAKDALETDKPWERWEFCHKRGEYQSLDSHPEWVVDNKYRRKPKSILINGHEVPEPHRAPLEDGTVYWTITPFSDVCVHNWVGNREDFYALKNGFIQLTQEGAKKHSVAVKSFTAQKE